MREELAKELYRWIDEKSQSIPWESLTEYHKEPHYRVADFLIKQVIQPYLDQQVAEAVKKERERVIAEVKKEIGMLYQQYDAHGKKTEDDAKAVERVYFIGGGRLKSLWQSLKGELK